MSCTDNVSNIKISGKIIQEKTSGPVNGVEVLAYCWQTTGIDDSYLETKKVVSDSNGHYEFFFEKGYEVGIAAKKKGYNPKRLVLNVQSNTIHADLRLNPVVKNNFLVSSLELHEDRSYLLVYSKKIFKASSNAQRIDSCGINVAIGNVEGDYSKADFWFDFGLHPGNLSPVYCKSVGGLIPIYKKDVSSSFWFDLIDAPTVGYRQACEFTDDIAGFFFRSKDGAHYGKIVISRSKELRSYSNGTGGLSRESSIGVGYLYQSNGSTNLAYSTDSVDLNTFLMQGQVR